MKKGLVNPSFLMVRYEANPMRYPATPAENGNGLYFFEGKDYNYNDWQITLETENRYERNSPLYYDERALPSVSS